MNKCGNSDETKFFVQPSEICSIKSLKLLEKNNHGNYYDKNYIFNSDFKKDNTLNSIYRDSNNNYIYNYDVNKKDLCYSLDTENKVWNINCAILHNNPFLTYDESTNKCVALPNLNFDNKLFIEDDKIKINNLEKLPNSSYKNEKFYCDNKWYDWIITPNFHFGNQYERDSGDYDPKDVRKCYKPCKKGYMPYKIDSKEFICIPKNESDDGMYTKKMDYTPLALINMIGNTKETLKDLYNKLFQQEFIRNYDNSFVTINKNIQYNSNVLIQEGWNQICSCIRDNIIDEKSMNNKNLENNPNVISYLNPYFNENDDTLITLRGMNTYDLDNDVILLHTYELANSYKTFIGILKYDSRFQNDNLNITKDYIINDKYNIKNKQDLGNYSLSKQQRLANILYKAINICYDGKSDFSNKLIELTKTAFEKSNNKNYSFTKIEKLEIEFIDDLNSFLKRTDDSNWNKYVTLFNPSNPIAIFYTTENNQKPNNCSNEGEILDIKENKCVSCNTYCNKETCNTDINCMTFCENTCDSLKSNNSTSCGTTKKSDNNYKRNNNFQSIDTPVEEKINIPSFSTIIRTVVKLLLALIFIYLCYVLFQMYGETIITVFNMIELLIRWIFIKLIYIIGGLFKGKGFANSNLEADFAYIEYIRNNAVNKFERLNNKIAFAEKPK